MTKINQHKIACMVCNAILQEEEAFGVKEICRGGGGYVHAIGCFGCMKKYMLSDGNIDDLIKDGKQITMVKKIHIWFE